MKLQINTTSNKRHISQHWTDTTSNPVTDTARHNFIYNTDTTASLKGRRIIENICEAVIPQEKKTPSLHYHTAQKLHGHTFSSVNPRAIFTNTATCCGSGNVPALSGLAGMSLRQAAGPLCLSVSVGTDMLTSDRTDSWQEGVFFCFLLVHLQSISERVLSALACLLVDRMVCLTPERGWNKQMVQVKENRFSHWDQHSVREVGEVSSNHISESFATNMTFICRKKTSGETKLWNFTQNWELLSALKLCIITLSCIPEAACLQQAPLLAVNSLQGVFIHRGQDSATAVSGRKAQWSLKKALVPPLWLPHRCDVETSRNNNVDGENQDEGMGGMGTFTSAELNFYRLLQSCCKNTLC